MKKMDLNNQVADYSTKTQDPDMLALLGRLPQRTALSLTAQQLNDLKMALGKGGWRKHKVDFRGTFSIPFLPERIYFVLLMGKNKRDLSRQEQKISLLALMTMVLVFLLLSTALGLVMVYIIKSALGINLLADYSLGLWDWLRGS